MRLSLNLANFGILTFPTVAWFFYTSIGRGLSLFILLAHVSFAIHHMRTPLPSASFSDIGPDQIRTLLPLPLYKELLHHADLLLPADSGHLHAGDIRRADRLRDRLHGKCPSCGLSF